MTERFGGKDPLPEIGAVVLRHIAYTPIVRGYDMNKYIIQGGHPLSGVVTVSGAKNAAVAILPAALLINGTCRIENVPDISDVRLLLEILDSMGAKIRRLSPNTLELCCTNVRDSEAPTRWCAVSAPPIISSARSSAASAMPAWRCPAAATSARAPSTSTSRASSHRCRR